MFRRIYYTFRRFAHELIQSEIGKKWALKIHETAYPELHKWGRFSFSQEGEDLLVNKLLQTTPIGEYVEIGAFDPIRYSNTYLFYLKGWKGLLVEPNSAFCNPIRRRRPRDTHYKIGISTEKCILEYFKFRFPEYNTFSAEIAQERVQQGIPLLETDSLETVTLAECLSRYFGPNPVSFELLSVDVEGLDQQVLESNDWNKYRPKVVICESSDGSHTRSFMEKVGYLHLSSLVRSHIYVAEEFSKEAGGLK